MTRPELIEMITRGVYGDFPNDDAAITDNLMNKWIGIGLALAAKQNSIDVFKIDGADYVNSSFYLTYRNLTIAQENTEDQTFKVQLPHVPIGLGRVEGINNLRIKDENGKWYDGALLNPDQVNYFRGMRDIPGKFPYWFEGDTIYLRSKIEWTTLNGFRPVAFVTMISGGDPTNRDANMNIPDDYIPVVVDYVKKQATDMLKMPQDLTNDGTDTR